eukprot:350758-Chlamydomonas_euryale.AAC.7
MLREAGVAYNCGKAACMRPRSSCTSPSAAPMMASWCGCRAWGVARLTWLSCIAVPEGTVNCVSWLLPSMFIFIPSIPHRHATPAPHLFERRIYHCVAGPAHCLDGGKPTERRVELRVPAFMARDEAAGAQPIGGRRHGRCHVPVEGKWKGSGREEGKWKGSGREEGVEKELKGGRHICAAVFDNMVAYQSSWISTPPSLHGA